jgi:hypothetical protein
MLTGAALIQNLAFQHGGLDYRAWRVAIGVGLFLTHYDDIFRDASPGQQPVNLGGLRAPVSWFLDHDHQIDIAVRARIPTGV